MRTLWIISAVTVAASVLFGSESRAQQPDFSGSWTTTRPEAARADDGAGARGARGTGRRGGRGGFRGGRSAAFQANAGSGWGEQFSIEQQEELLIVERVFFGRNDMQPSLKLRFPLDGSTHRNDLLMGRGIQHADTTAAWDDEQLVLTTTRFYQSPNAEGPIPYQVVQTLSPQQDDNNADAAQQLVMETRCQAIPGSDGNETTSRVVYYHDDP